MNRIYLIAVFICFASLFSKLGAQEDFKRFTGYPILAYSTETKLMIGGFTIYRPYEATSANAQPLILTNAIYSFKKQFQLLLVPEWFFADGQYAVKAIGRFRNWPDEFYGVGNNSKESDKEKYTQIQNGAELQLTLKLAESISLGLNTEIYQYDMKKIEDGGLLQYGAYNGKGKFNAVGVGGVVAWNSTNSANYPTQGSKVVLSNLVFDTQLGSEYAFKTWAANIATYLPISSSSVLALAGDVKWNTGEVPLQNLPALGNNLRAYSSNRFIDKTRAAGQLEFRVFPWEEGVGSRWGFAAFGEAGQVAEEFKQMQWNETKISYGGGIRYSLFTGDRLNLRVDYAISKEGTNFIITGREAF